MLGGKKEVIGRQTPTNIKINLPLHSENADKFPALIEFVPQTRVAKKRIDTTGREGSAESRRNFLKGRHREILWDESEPKVAKTTIGKPSARDKHKSNHDNSSGAQTERSHLKGQFLHLKRPKLLGTDKAEDNPSSLLKSKSRIGGGVQSTQTIHQSKVGGSNLKTIGNLVANKAIETKRKKKLKPKQATNLNTEANEPSKSPTTKRAVSPSPADSKRSTETVSALAHLIQQGKSPLGAKKYQPAVSKEYDLLPSKKLFSRIQRNLQTSPSPSVSTSSRGNLTSYGKAITGRKDNSTEQARRLNRVDGANIVGSSCSSSNTDNTGHSMNLVNQFHSQINKPSAAVGVVKNDKADNKLKYLFDKAKKMVESGVQKNEKLKKHKDLAHEFASLMNSATKATHLFSSIADEEATARESSSQHKSKVTLSAFHGLTSPHTAAKKREGIKSKMSGQHTKSSTTKKKSSVIKSKKTEIEKDKDHSARKIRNKKKARIIGNIGSKDVHTHLGQPNTESSHAIINVLKRAGDKDLITRGDRIAISSVHSQNLSGNINTLPASSLKLDPGHLHYITKKGAHVNWQSSSEEGSGPISVRQDERHSNAPEPSIREITQSVSKIQKQWRLYRSKLQPFNEYPSTPSSASGNDNEPVCMKTSSAQSSQQDPPVQDKINPKDEIEKRYRQFAEENERRWKDLLKSIERVEVGNPSSGNESFLARIEDIRYKGDLCVRLLKAENKISKGSNYLDFRKNKEHSKPIYLKRNTRLMTELSRDSEERPDPVVSPDNIPYFISSPKNHQPIQHPRGIAISPKNSNNKYSTPAQVKFQKSIPADSVSSLQFKSIDGFIPETSVKSNGNSKILNTGSNANNPTLPIPGDSQPISEVVSSSKQLSNLQLASAQITSQAPKSPSLISPRRYNEPYPTQVPVSPLPTVNMPPYIPLHPILSFSPSSTGLVASRMTNFHHNVASGNAGAARQSTGAQQGPQSNIRRSDSLDTNSNRTDVLSSNNILFPQPKIPLLTSQSLHKTIDKCRESAPNDSPSQDGAQVEAVAIKLGGSPPRISGHLNSDRAKPKSVLLPASTAKQGQQKILQAVPSGNSIDVLKNCIGKIIEKSYSSRSLVEERSNRDLSGNSRENGWKDAVSIDGQNDKQECGDHNESSFKNRVISKDNTDGPFHKKSGASPEEVQCVTGSKFNFSDKSFKDQPIISEMAETLDLKNIKTFYATVGNEDYNLMRKSKGLCSVASNEEVCNESSNSSKRAITQVDDEEGNSQEKAQVLLQTPSSERQQSCIKVHNNPSRVQAVRHTRLNYHVNTNKNLNIYEFNQSDEMREKESPSEGFCSPDPSKLQAMEKIESKSSFRSAEEQIEARRVNSFAESTVQDNNNEEKIDEIRYDKQKVKNAEQTQQNDSLTQDKNHDFQNKSSVVVINSDENEGDGTPDDEQENAVETEEPMFATTSEKADIITSFILEHLIIEAINENFCLNKFIQILGPHMKHLDYQALSKYIDNLFAQLQPSKPHGTVNEPSYAISHSTLYNVADNAGFSPDSCHSRPSAGRSILGGEDSGSLNQTNTLTFKSLGQIQTRLNTPIGHTDLHRLLLASPLLPEADADVLAPFEYEPVLDIKMYISLEETLREGQYKVRGLDGFEMEKEHIVHKLIFDSLNECLDYKRRGGVGGGAIKFGSKYRDQRYFQECEVMDVLLKAREEVLGWSKVKAGALMEKEPQFGYYSDNDGLEIVREKSMASLIHEYIDATDVKWKEYTDEFLEVFLILSDFTFEYLVEETVVDMRTLSLSRANLS